MFFRKKLKEEIRKLQIRLTAHEAKRRELIAANADSVSKISELAHDLGVQKREIRNLEFRKEAAVEELVKSETKLAHTQIVLKYGYGVDVGKITEQIARDVRISSKVPESLMIKEKPLTSVLFKDVENDHDEW